MGIVVEWSSGGKRWDENNADSGRGMIDRFRFVMGSREEL
jgi:hypothetical protein